MKQKILEILENAFDPEIAEMKAEEIMGLFACDKIESIRIICKYLNKVFEMGLKQSPYDANNSEFYLPMIEFDIAPKLYKELKKIE